MITLVLITSWSMLKPCMVRDANSVVFSFFMEYDSDNFWFDLYVVSVVLITLPILPISAPLLWVILYLNGEAKTLVRCLTSPDKSNFKAVSCSECCDSSFSDERCHSNEMCKWLLFQAKKVGDFRESCNRGS